MESNTSLPAVPYDKDAIYTALTQFDESDPEFQAGIQTILGPMQASGASPEQIEQTKKRAKVFFWSQKTGNQVDYADYTTWLSTQSGANDAWILKAADAQGEGEAQNEKEKEPYPASFDAIVELITTGKTDQIPGIRDIPLKINEEQPTQATMSRPKKPWESAKTPAVASSEAPTQAQDSIDSSATATHTEANFAA